MALRIGVFLLWAVGASADTSPRRGPEWYPLGVGTTWKYSSQAGDYTVMVVGRRKIGPVDCAVLEMRTNGKKTATNAVGRDADGYRVFTSEETGSASKSGKPMTVLGLPMKQGSTWTWTGPYSGTDAKVTYTDLGKETIAVLGKNVSCRKIRSRLELTGVQFGIDLTTWYAPDKGPVLMRYGYGGAEMGGNRFQMDMKLKEFLPSRR